jgi:PAS domain S-box-containing protein
MAKSSPHRHGDSSPETCSCGENISLRALRQSGRSFREIQAELAAATRRIEQLERRLAEVDPDYDSKACPDEAFACACETSFPDTIPRPIFRADMHGRLHYANPAGLCVAAELLGGESTITRTAVLDLVDEALRKGGSASVELEVGDIVYQVLVAPLPGGSYANIFCQDITPWRRSEGQLRLAHESMEHEVARKTAELTRINQRLENEVEERQQAELMLGQSVAQLEAIFENSLVGVAFLQGGRVLQRANRRLCQILGYDEGELDGCQTTLAHLHANAARVFGERYYAQLANRDIFHIHYRLRRKDGSPVWCSLSGKAIDPTNLDEGVIWIIDDISTVKKAQNEARRQRAMLRALIDSIPDIIFYKDLQGRYLGCNPAFGQLVGRSPEEIVGTTDHDLFEPEVADFFREQDSIMLTRGRPRANEEEVVYPDGRVVSLETLKTPYRGPGGELLGLVGIGRDITSKKQAQALQEEMERITRHDLKTPLNAIIGLPQALLEEGGLSEGQTDAVEMILESGYRMLDMINLSLDLVRMEHGSYRLKPQPVDLGRLFQVILRELAPAIAAKKLDVRIEDECGERGCAALGEELLCYSLFANLLKNAVEASPRGEIIRVSIADFGPDRLGITVGNTGGVPADLRERFFDKFATGGKDGGTGLGTYAASLIAELHGGAIRLLDTPPDKTAIEVELPVAG